MIEFDEVVKRVRKEFEHAKYWDAQRPPGAKMDADKDMETWFLWMEEWLSKAKSAATMTLDKTEALHSLRRVLNLGFNCAMWHEMPERK